MNERTVETLKKWVAMNVTVQYGPSITFDEWEVRIMHDNWTTCTLGELDEAISECDARLTLHTTNENPS